MVGVYIAGALVAALVIALSIWIADGRSPLHALRPARKHAQLANDQTVTAQPTRGEHTFG
jgi:hypothetical protein